MDYEYIRKQRNKVSELKQSRWWKNQKGKGRCHYCQKTVMPALLTMDHKIPLARGGKTSRSNVVPSCLDCNQAKQYFTAEEWTARPQKPADAP